MKIAFHAINGVGLGHVVRTICLATEMRELVPNVELLVLTNAGDTGLLERAHLDFVQLPPRANEPHADPDRSRTALPPELEEAALIAALEVFTPDLVVFDTHAPMRVVRHLTKMGARSVLVLRELRPEALRSFANSGAPQAFDRIVVPHEPGEIDLDVLAGTPVTLVGAIVRNDETRGPTSSGAAKKNTHRSSREARPPLIVAMAGGGGQPMDARRYVRAVADAHLLVRARIPTLETVLVTGPYGVSPPNVAREYEGLTVLRTSDDVAALLASATLVVSQAGYNAVAEIRALAKPAVLVPGHRKAEDQKVRARRLVRAKAAVMAKPEARSIADRIEALLLTPNALDTMAKAHRANPLIPKNRAAAEAVLRPIHIIPSAAAAAPAAAPARSAAPRPLKVAIVAHDFAPKLGGMETVARSLASSLLARGMDARVYTTNRLGARTASGLAEGVVRTLYQALPPPLRIDLWSDLLATIDAALCDAPDVIHLCHAGLGPWIPLLRAALPCVVTANVHGNDLLAPWVHHAQTPESYRSAQIDGLSAADAVLCVSSFSRDLARSSGVREEVLHIIENGVNPGRFSPSSSGDEDATSLSDGNANALAGRLGLSPGDEVVLTVSRLAPRKGHRTVLHAIAALAKRRPLLKYVFTGASESLRTELSALAAELGIASRIVATGFVSDAELPALYRLANVFVLLAEGEEKADVEGFGVALLEAAASGLPTIASRTGGVPEAIVDGETGLLVAPGDPNEAAVAIERLLSDQKLARAFGERGRARVVSSFSHEHAADRVVQIWRSILERDAGSSTGGRNPSPLMQAMPRLALGASPTQIDESSVDGEERSDAAVDRGFGGRAPKGVDEQAAGTADTSAAFALVSSAANGVELVRLAQAHGAKLRADRIARRETFRTVIARGQLVRLRATSDGVRFLPDALDDCASLGHAPRVEVKLRRFLERDFVEHALPLASEIELVHGVPYLSHPLTQQAASSPAHLLHALAALPPETIGRVRTVRLFLTPEAQANPALAVRAVPETHALRRFFAQRGWVVGSPREEMREERGAVVVPPPELMRYLSELPAGGPETGMIEPTNLCNLACPTCPTGTGKIKPLPQMTLEKFDRVMDALAPRMRNLALWNYGEPLLNRELPQMIAHAKKAGVGVVKVSSNVHFLDGARGLALLKSGLDVLILSVDGASQATYETFRKDGDFEKVATSVAWLCAEKKRLGLAKPRIELQFIAMRHNEHELPEMRRLAREWGVDKLRVKTVGADDEATKELVPTSRLLSRYEADHTTPNVRHTFCTMAWDHTVVNVDGSVTPCCYLRPDMGEAFVMGNVFETTFPEIWRGEKYRSFRASMLSGRASMPVCNRCRGGTHDLIAAVEEVPSS